LAAAQGDVLAQNAIGSMYENGRGVTQDYVLAHMWLDLAGANGDAAAIVERDLLASKMTPNQLAEAQRRAREWKPKAPR